MSKEQFVHDPEAEHSSLPPSSRISHDRESGGIYWIENSLAGKQQHQNNSKYWVNSSQHCYIDYPVIELDSTFFNRFVSQQLWGTQGVSSSN